MLAYPSNQLSQQLSISWRQVLIPVSVCTLVTYILLFSFIRLNAGGHAWAAMFPGAIFPPPDYALEQSDIKPVMPGGWDGQFYLYQSYDPFIAYPEQANQSFDAAAYRYQRNLIPTLAWLLGSTIIAGDRAVAYLIVQISIVVAASIYLGLFLIRSGWSAWLLIPLHLNAGVIATLRHGLPDVSADFILYAACVSLLLKRRELSCVLLTALCLTREPYVVFALGILLTQTWSIWRQRTLLNDWFRKLIKVGVLFSVPLLIAAAWNLYIRIRLGASPSEQGGAMISWPFSGLVLGVEQMLKEGKPWIESISAVYFGSLLILGIGLAAWSWRRSSLALPLGLMCLLNAGISWIGWYTWPHHSKNFSYLLGVLPILVIAGQLPFPRWAMMLVLSPAVGIAAWIIIPSVWLAEPLQTHGYREVSLEQEFFQQRPVNRERFLKQSGFDDARGFPTSVSVTDHRAVITALRSQIRAGASGLVTIPVVFVNTSAQPWSPFFREGIDPVRISVKWFNDANELMTHRTYSLNRYVYPGEGTFADLRVAPPAKSGKFKVSISLAQTPVSSFDTVIPSAKADILVEIR